MKYFDKIKKILIHESIQKIVYKFGLNESVKIADKIQKVLDAEGVKITEPAEDLVIGLVDKNNKMVTVNNQQMKLSKILSKILPDLNPTGSEFNNLLSKIQVAIMQDGGSDKESITDQEGNVYTFNMYKDVSNHYDVVSSCMTKDSTCHLPKVYDGEPDIFVLIQNKNDQAVGRTLIWRNVEGLNGKLYMDRLYPTDNETIKRNFLKYAEMQGMVTRRTNDIQNIDVGVDTISYTFKQPASVIKRMPYMDIFRYGDVENDV